MHEGNGAAARLVEALIAARESGVPLPRAQADGFEAGLDLEASCRVQQAVCDRFGPVGGWKVGRAANGQAIMAPVLAGTLRKSGASYTRRDITRCGIELEIAFRVDRPLPPVDDADFARLARDCVTPVAAIEICDGRFEDFVTLPPLVKLADNQMNGGLVHGTTRLGDGREVDLSRPIVRLAFNGEPVVEGRQDVPGGGAFENFIALARIVGTHCGGLKPGQFVTTGTLTGMPFIDPGTEVTGWIEGLGEVRTAFR